MSDSDKYNKVTQKTERTMQGRCMVEKDYFSQNSQGKRAMMRRRQP